MKVSVMVVDDEPLARKLIENLLETISEVQIIGQCGTGKDAINLIDKLNPDILFLDIQLKDMNGFDVLNTIKNPSPLIIFVTAFDSYAIKAFEVFAFDYLLKPYTEKRFYKSVYKAIETLKNTESDVFQNTISNLLNHVQSTKNILNSSRLNRIPVPSGNKTIFVLPEDILYISASNYYVEIYTAKSKYLLRTSMNKMTSELDSASFIRIHRSSIVNITYIDELINSNQGEIDVKMKDSKLFRISKSYRKSFLTKMGIRK